LSEAPAPPSMPLSARPTAMPDAGNGSLMNLDEDEQAQTGNADEHRSRLGAGYNLVHETVARLARRTPSLLLAQLDAASDEDARIQTLRALEHRLTTYIRAVERLVDTWEENPQASNHLADPVSAQREPGAGGGDREDVPRRSGHLQILQADLETLIASVDLFVDAPGEGDGLSELETRLGDAEGRLQALLSESSAVAPAAAHPAAPWRPSQHHHREREKTTTTEAPEPRPRASDEQAIPEEEQWDTTPEKPQPSDRPDAMQDLERAGLDGRVRRLESRIRLDNFLLVILAVLLAASWWWSGAFAPEPGDEQGTPELPADGPEDLLLLPRAETSEQGAQVDMPSDTESADQETGIRLPGAAIESMEDQVADPSLRKATEAPLLQEGTTPTGERDSVPPGTAESVPDEAPTGKAKESTTGRVGARTLKEPSYGVQLVAFKDKPAMTSFIQNTELGGNAVYARSSVKSGRLYILVKGFYPTRDEAQKVAEALPAELKSLEPWVKRYPAGMTYYQIDSQ
jgi:septal ring-binding cell division protein DamX